MTKFCMGCMDQYEDEYEVCPSCGYIEDTKVEESLHMEPGSILSDRYIIGRVLGFGGFGVTYLGWDATLEQKVAIKEYLPSEFSTRVPSQTQITVYTGDKADQFANGLVNFVEEAQRLAKFHREDGIVRIFDSFETNNTAYIIMEYLQGETLAEYLKREKTVPVERAIAMLLPIINSLKVVNEQGVIHRDIAPDNIFLTHDGKVKLIDFGSARFATTTHSRSLTVIIKPGFSPEEQYRSRGDQGSYTDVYAIGATLYRMITGVAPPDALERRAHFESKKKDILKPAGKFTNALTENQETAILNAINVRIEDRTPDMATFASELATVEPEKVRRLYGKIKRIDVLKWPLWAKISTVAAMFAVVFLSTLFATGVIGFDALLQTDIEIPDGMSRVPSVVNRNLEEAETFFHNSELLFSIAGRDYSDEIPVDFVLLQSINGGTLVETNTVIDIIISGGEGGQIIPGLVPSLLFREEDEAVGMVEASELTVEIIFDYSETVAEGLVMLQYPNAGISLPIGERVSITISAGLPPFDMPDVVGMSEEEASALLFELGFIVDIERESSNTVEEGYVISQNVEINSEVRRGERITIIISTGPEIVEEVDVSTTESTLVLPPGGGQTPPMSGTQPPQGGGQTPPPQSVAPTATFSNVNLCVGMKTGGFSSTFTVSASSYVTMVDIVLSPFPEFLHEFDIVFPQSITQHSMVSTHSLNLGSIGIWNSTPSIVSFQISVLVEGEWIRSPWYQVDFTSDFDSSIITGSACW